MQQAALTERPRIVCLCGSTRFREAFDEAFVRETLAGRVVLTLALFAHGPAPTVQITTELKLRLDELHLAKIDLADEVLVLNVGGYVGASTRREAWYAGRQGKALRWLEPMMVRTAEPEEWFTDWDAWRAAAAEAARG